MVSTINQILYYIVKSFHISITIITNLSIIFLPWQYTPIIIFLILFIMTHWYFNNYNCILTNIENYLLDKPISTNKNIEESYNKHGQTYILINDVFKLNLTSIQMHNMSMMFLLLIIIVLSIRYKYKYNFINYSKIFKYIFINIS